MKKKKKKNIEESNSVGKVSVAGEKGIKFMNTEKMRSQKGY